MEWAARRDSGVPAKNTQKPVRACQAGSSRGRRWANPDVTVSAENGILHRRCAAHHEFLVNGPDVVAFAEDWADRNLDDLAQR